MFCAWALFVIFTCIEEQQGEGMQMQGLAENFSSPRPWEFGFRRNCTPNSLKNFRDNAA